ncbi:hypothetical protein C4544_04075 [candidate division WS5 bacterium]|uniref:Uncharacterized protein n=1 Tax=candidate division WS5 bacterium TaxID=2093353 RepID=A0A419DCW6_9BACT|nr:MAG: hypothetical protein C4544_04075 [candidate division WS5 bacterium]
MNLNMAILLRVVRSEGSIDPLIERGLTYSQIANLLEEAKNTELIIVREGKLLISATGEKLLNVMSSKKLIPKPGGWIRPLDEHKLPKISQCDIYLPKNPPHDIGEKGE